MRVILIAIVGSLLAFSAYMMLSPQPAGEAVAADGEPAFFAKVGRQLNIAVVGSPEVASAFRTTLQSLDKADVVSDLDPQENLAQADAIVYLLPNWSSIETAPWQDVYKDEYAFIAESEDSSFSLALQNGEQERPLYRQYYDLSHYDWDMECYTALFLHAVSRPWDETFNRSSDCAI